jgi:ATP-dependent DNA helicase
VCADSENVILISPRPPLGKFKVPIGRSSKAGEARQTIAEMAAQLLELEGEHIERTGAGKQHGIIGDVELDMLLDRRREVFEGRRVGWKSRSSRGGGGSKGAAASSSDGARAASEEEEEEESPGWVWECA